MLKETAAWTVTRSSSEAQMARLKQREPGDNPTAKACLAGAIPACLRLFMRRLGKLGETVPRLRGGDCRRLDDERPPLNPTERIG